MRMPSSLTLLTLARMAAMALTMQVGLTATSAAQRQESNKESIVGRSQIEPVRTGKERLGGKASDPQRVDNCKVPLDQRGSTPRPDGCDDATRLPPNRR
jgi:hypothetical protein